MKKDPGLLVKMKSGKVGRTYHNRPRINGKTVVYPATRFLMLEGDKGSKESFPIEFESEGILCDPETLVTLGHID